MSIPRTFHTLMNVWQADCTSHQVDVLASEVAAGLAREGFALVALMELECVVTLNNLGAFLKPYGVTVSVSRKDAGTAYVFAFIDPGECSASPKRYHLVRWRKEK
jgi:hypothetical protein